ALCSGLKRKWSSVLWCGLATRTTSPPRPPSPPLGPPRGTYFSRRKARQPLPPSPALTRMRTSSINIEHTENRKAAGPERTGGLLKTALQDLYDGCADADELAHAAAVLEFHDA